MAVSVLNTVFVCNVMAKDVAKKDKGGEVGNPIYPLPVYEVLEPWSPTAPARLKYEYKRFSKNYVDYIEINGVSEDGSTEYKNYAESPASNVTSVKISGVDYLRIETFDVYHKPSVNFIPMTQTKINSLGNCEEVNEQYTICNGNKYIREKNVTENLKRTMKDVEAVAGQKDKTKENKNSAK